MRPTLPDIHVVLAIIDTAQALILLVAVRSFRLNTALIQAAILLCSKERCIDRQSRAHASQDPNWLVISLQNCAPSHFQSGIFNLGTRRT
jgi:hypothetical protein